jgi:hypothetical protein
MRNTIAKKNIRSGKFGNGLCSLKTSLLIRITLINTYPEKQHKKIANRSFGNNITAGMPQAINPIAPE